MKSRIIIAVSIILMAAVAVTCYFKYADYGLNSSIALGFSAQEFTKSDNISHLRVVFDDDRNTNKEIAVKNEALINELSNANPEDIIGGQIMLHIPEKVIREKHLDKSKVNPMHLLTMSDEYNEYFELADVSFK